MQYAKGFCRVHYHRHRRGAVMETPICLKVQGPAKERLKARIFRDPATGCHVWTGFRDPIGYGRVRDDAGRKCAAHRLAWEIANGPIPAGLHVLHHCDNPACCNPEHLYLGTPADNARDRLARNRTKGARARDLKRYPQWGSV